MKYQTRETTDKSRIMQQDYGPSRRKWVRSPVQRPVRVSAGKTKANDSKLPQNPRPPGSPATCITDSDGRTSTGTRGTVPQCWSAHPEIFTPNRAGSQPSNLFGFRTHPEKRLLRWILFNDHVINGLVHINEGYIESSLRGNLDYYMGGCGPIESKVTAWNHESTGGKL